MLADARAAAGIKTPEDRVPELEAENRKLRVRVAELEAAQQEKAKEKK